MELQQKKKKAVHEWSLPCSMYYQINPAIPSCVSQSHWPAEQLYWCDSPLLLLRKLIYSCQFCSLILEITTYETLNTIFYLPMLRRCAQTHKSVLWNCSISFSLNWNDKNSQLWITVWLFSLGQHGKLAPLNTWVTPPCVRFKKEPKFTKLKMTVFVQSSRLHEEPDLV